MITEGFLARHYHGRRGGRDIALLDVAQDYALKLMSDKGLFDLGLTFKGGTALRKFRMGHQGRFSKDLDFAANEEGLGDLLFEQLHGASLYEVVFRAEVITPDRRALFHVETPLGSPQVDARIEVIPRAPWLLKEVREPIHLFVHQGYEFAPVAAPVMRLEESLAEKLAALRRRRLARDLYDLAWLSAVPFSEDLVRKLTHLKIYMDCVVDRLDERPFDPQSDVLNRQPGDFEPEDIGLLAGEVDIPKWLEAVRRRFGFLANQTEEEKEWAQCNGRDLEGIRAVIRSL